jgi:hypothetical protein
LTCIENVYTIRPMSRKAATARTRTKELRTKPLLVRLQPTEKEAFQDAAELAGIPLSTWVRERLRQSAVRELEAAAHPIAFLRHIQMD